MTTVITIHTQTQSQMPKANDHQPTNTCLLYKDRFIVQNFPPSSSSLWVQILSSAFCSETPSTRVLGVKDQVSHLCETKFSYRYDLLITLHHILRIVLAHQPTCMSGIPVYKPVNIDWSFAIMNLAFPLGVSSRVDFRLHQTDLVMFHVQSCITNRHCIIMVTYSVGKGL